MSWSNWAGTTRCTPTSVHQPQTIQELESIIKAAAFAKSTVRPLGAGHSFTPVATTSDIRIQLDHLSGISGLDMENGTVTFRAGTRLRDVPDLLGPIGLALTNQGDVDPQSVAGAVSTGTHGTGLGYTGFGGMLRSFKLVTPDGRERLCSPDADGIDAEIFRLGRIGLGLFGVLTELTFDTVPAFHLAADEHAENFEELRQTFPERARAADHLEFFIFPGTDTALVKENTRVPASDYEEWTRRDGGIHRTPSKLLTAQKFFSEEIVGNAALWAMCEASRLRPSLTSRLNSIAVGSVPEQKYIDEAHKVFVSPRRVRFSEMEYGIPLNDAPDVLSDIRSAIDRSNSCVSFPLEVRTAAADDVALSTAYGRETCYIAVHRYHRENWRNYFGLIEPILRAAGGRPHWGKLHSLQNSALREAYPLFDEVNDLRRRVDPDGLFLNPYLANLFDG